MSEGEGLDTHKLCHFLSFSALSHPSSTLFSPTSAPTLVSAESRDATSFSLTVLVCISAVGEGQSTLM